MTDDYFNCTARDRALFEAGIKLGALFHQFVGTPVNLSSVEYLEKAIMRSVMAQPYVVDATVHIDRSTLVSGPYGYSSLAGEMLDVSLLLEHSGVAVRARLRYVEELDYPLMYVESVSDQCCIP